MTLRHRNKKASRKSRKIRRPFIGGNKKYANVFLIDVSTSLSSQKTKTCYPKGKEDNVPCHEPEWIYTPAGKITNKVLCVTDKQKKDKKQNKGNDAVAKTVDDIIQKGGKEGDLVENVAESGYRTQGVYILKTKKNKLVISPLDNDHDPYGHVGSEFSLGPDFPVGYWSFAFQKGAQISVTGNDLKSKASWHNDTEQAEPVDKKTIKSIKQNQLKKTKNENEVDVTFPWGTLRFPFATLKEIKKVDYKNNRIYFEPEEGEDNGVAIMHEY